MFHRIYRQVDYDIFFVDWEYDKDLLTTSKIREHFVLDIDNKNFFFLLTKKRPHPTCYIQYYIVKSIKKLVKFL